MINILTTRPNPSSDQRRKDQSQGSIAISVTIWALEADDIAGPSVYKYK